MGMAKKGSRVLIVDGVRYRWRASSDPWFWQERWAAACDAPVRVVVQADGGGPYLVATFAACREHAIKALREPFNSGFARKLILAALAKGWAPHQRGSQMMTLDHAEVIQAVAEPDAVAEEPRA
jgi:hypothetical protein